MPVNNSIALEGVVVRTTPIEFPLNLNGGPIPALGGKSAVIKGSRPPKALASSIAESIDSLPIGDALGIAEVAIKLFNSKKYITPANREDRRAQVISGDPPKFIEDPFDPDFDTLGVAMKIASNPTPIGIATAIFSEILDFDIMGRVEKQLRNLEDIQMWEEENNKKISSAMQAGIASNQTRLESEMKVLANGLEKQMESKILVVTGRSKKIPKLEYRWSNNKQSKLNYQPIMSEPYNNQEPLSIILKFPETEIHKTLFKSDGHLQDELITLLSKAFNFNPSALKQSIWQHYGKTDRGRIWFHQMGYPIASTSGQFVYFNTDQLLASFGSWINLISHEESHRQDTYKSSNFEFYLNYLIEGIYKKYEKISTEEKAFLHGADENRNIKSLADQLLQFENGIIEEILKSKKFAPAEKSKLLKKVGLRFRSVKLKEELDNYSKIIQDLNQKLNNRSLDRDEQAKIKLYLKLITQFEETIKKEIEKIKLELSK